MILQGQILNNFSNEPLPGAKLFLYCHSGNVHLGDADDKGYFRVDVPNGTTPLVLSAPGFMSVLADPAVIDDAGSIALTPSLNTDQVEVLKSNSNGQTKTKIPWWVVVGGGLFIGSMGRKKGVGAADYSKYILPAGLLLLGYYLVNNIGDIFGSNANKSDNQQVTDSNAAATDSSISAAKNSGDRQTLSDSQLSGIANSIWTIGTSEDFGKLSSSAFDQIYQAISGVGSLTDWLLVKKYFGTKQAGQHWYSACSLVGINCTAFDLDSFLRGVLDNDQVGYINNYFQSASINYSL